MKAKIKNIMTDYMDIAGIFFVLVILVVFFSLISDKFLTSSNLMRILLNVSSIGIMAIGQGLVIILAGLDLSVSSTFAISGIITGIGMTKLSLGFFPSILIGILSGTVVGGINAFLILKAGINSFITTFGMLSVIRGVSYAISGGYTIPITDPLFLALGAYVGPIPMPAIFFIALGIIFFIIMKRTSFGAALFATGANEKAAFYSGINVTKLKAGVYILCATMAAFSGIISSAKIGMASSTAGIGYELDVITAVILGGVSLKGGKGNILGIIIGTVIMGVIRNGLLIMNISAYYQTAIIGFIIIFVVVLDSIRGNNLINIFKK